MPPPAAVITGCGHRLVTFTLTGVQLSPASRPRPFALSRYRRHVQCQPTGATAQIPVFASVPSKLNARQAFSFSYVKACLQGNGLEPRTVGVSDPAMLNPLHEVRTLARHCAGGIIMGYRQITASVVQTPQWVVTGAGEREIKPGRIKPYAAPTPWNQLETGILFGLGLPLFVLREDGITGGIFDAGSSDVLVHSMPMPKPDWVEDADEDPWVPWVQEGFQAALRRWQATVLTTYYRHP